MKFIINTQYKILNTKNGFTLLELLVVISIIGILMAVALASFSDAQIKARDSKRISDMKAYQSVFEQYYVVNGAYGTQAEMEAGFSGGSPPEDPREDQDNAAYYITPANIETAQTYCVCATVENDVNGNSNSNNCSAFGGAGTPYYCVRNLQ